MIQNKDFDTFFDYASKKDGEEEYSIDDPIEGRLPLPTNYLHFLYTYTICSADKKKLDKWLSDKEGQASPEHHVFRKLTTSDEALDTQNNPVHIQVYMESMHCL